MRTPTLAFLAATCAFLAAASAMACQIDQKVNRAGKGKFNPEKSVVFMGSSSIDYWNSTLQKDFAPAGVETINLGVAGKTYEHVLTHAPACAKKYPAKQFVLYSGENDMGFSLFGGGSALENFSASVRAIRKQVPDAKIYVYTVKPSPFHFLRRGEFQRFNANLKKRVDEMNKSAGKSYITVLDTWAEMDASSGVIKDSIHMTAKGYQIWIDKLMPHLKAFNAEQAKKAAAAKKPAAGAAADERAPAGSSANAQ